MKIRSIKIENFRGIRSLDILFDSSLTVLIGRNGAGKSSVLDAITFLIRPILGQNSAFGGYVQSHGLNLNDIRQGAEHVKMKLCTTSHAHNGFEEIGNETESYLELTAPFTRRFAPSVDFLKKDAPKPLVIYYSQTRQFDGRSKNIDTSQLREESISGKLSAISNLETWWDERDAQEGRQIRSKNDLSHRDPQLEGVRKLIRNIDGFTGARYDADARPKGLYFSKKDGSEVRADSLSSGERSYLILLADLARRLQTIEPNSALEDIPGVVLIDEIELNLHPMWQSEIIPTLLDVFKSCQFVITTHSPQVISTLKSKNVRALVRDEEGNVTSEPPINTKGRSSNYLLEGVFTAPEREPSVSQKIEEFNEAFDTGSVNDARSLFAEICNAIEGDPPELMVLKKRLRKLEESQ